MHQSSAEPTGHGKDIGPCEDKNSCAVLHSGSVAINVLTSVTQLYTGTSEPRLT
jgi:hypothetical protein